MDDKIDLSTGKAILTSHYDIVNQMQHVVIVYLNHDRAKTMGIFNPNAFPLVFDELVTSCSSRMATVLYNLRLIQNQLVIDKQIFIDSLSDERMKLKDAIHQKPGNWIAAYDSIEILTCLLSFLTSIKSFLDIFGNLICKLLNLKNESGFHKGNYNGNKISGGSLLNLIYKSKIDAVVKSKLLQIINDNSIEWITKLIDFRDLVLHRKDPSEIEQTQLVLSNTEPYIISDNISLFSVNGLSIDKYSKDIFDKYQSFIISVVSILPNIKIGLVDLKKIEL